MTSMTHKFTLSSTSIWKSVLVSAFLSFGLVIPSASAKCISDFSHAVPALQTGDSFAAPVEVPAVEGATATPTSAGIVGLWKVEFTSGGETVDVAFDAWHSDGTEILNDYTNPIEGNVCLGVWTQTGARTYKLKHPSWAFDSTGTLTGTVIIHETVTVSADGNSYKGKYAYDIYDTKGTFVTEYTGLITATRIRAD